MEHKCICKNYCGIEYLPGSYKVYIHASFCPKSSYSKEYREAKWYKRMFIKHPSYFLPRYI